jgi:hypothetical protein
MSERDDDRRSSTSPLVVIALIVAFWWALAGLIANARQADSIRDLQRRVGQLEEQVKQR